MLKRIGDNEDPSRTEVFKIIRELDDHLSGEGVS